ncbi:alpha-1,4-N-acetylglucosaminyltransferase-like, partial [Pleurodeles waltl]|uniref:alpha-1,4-N-acetylglucosaminyltransferase-like n=1 Tax=Pleurodeles waltl TaxID=8319 RepID=UPI0037094A44
RTTQRGSAALCSSVGGRRGKLTLHLTGAANHFHCDTRTSHWQTQTILKIAARNTGGPTLNPLNLSLVWNCGAHFKETWPVSPIVDPSQQRYWIHHVSDACREALLWKYGGIYMDTDVISIKPIQLEDFLVAESSTLCSSAVLGFRQNHPFLWDCMEDYVKNYDGNIWAKQGPQLFTRMAAKLCKMPDFATIGDGMCQNISYLQPKRFYPIPYPDWRRYYAKWENEDNMFAMSYGLHFWNYMNRDHMEVTAGSSTVAEYIFKNYCPLTYHSLLKMKPS